MDFGGTYVGYDQLSKPIDADGPSHFFISFGESSAFGPAGVEPVGSYDFNVRAIDSYGSGWEVMVPFSVSE